MSRINNAVRHNTDYFVSVLLLLQPCFKHLMPTIIGLPLFFIGFLLVYSISTNYCMKLNGSEHEQCPFDTLISQITIDKFCF